MSRTLHAVVAPLLAAASLLATGNALAQSLVGSIDVRTDPEGASVYVSGEFKGTSPCVVADVGVGQVEVKVEKEGYAAETTGIAVESGATARANFTLRELVNVGHIAVAVEPEGSLVKLDYVVRGRTPLRIINVDAGTHKLDVSREGYRPMVVAVVVVTGRERIVTGRLVQGGGFLEDPTAPPGERELTIPDLSPDSVPLPDQMPEEKAFEPVRRLLARRQYEEAVALLDRMAQQAGGYMGRIVRDRRLIEQVRPVVRAGYEALKGKVGHPYRLALRGGIAIEGRILSATDEHVEVDLHGAGRGRPIALNHLGASTVIKLATPSLTPGRPANHVAFAVLYGMEGAYGEAYDELRRARGAGHNVTEVKSYLDAEWLWAAAVKKQQELKRQQAEEEKERKEPDPSERQKGRPQILIDRHRGGWISGEIVERLESAGLEVRSTSQSLSDEDLDSAAVIVVRDAGPDRAVPSYDAPQLKRLFQYVSDGGALVFFAAPRPSPERPAKDANPFLPLLKQFRFAVRPGTLTVSQQAPEEHPREQAPALPHQRHPITAGINEVRFSLDCPTLIASRRTWLVATTAFVRSSVAGSGPIPMVAARPVGRGRVVVFASLPNTWDDEKGEDATRLVVNAVRWAAGSRARRTH